MMSRRVRWTIRGILITGVVIGVWIDQHRERYKHFAVHEDGMIYRSAWLEPDVMREVIERHQIRTVVNLCAPGEMGERRWREEREVVSNAGARLIEMPMTVMVQPEQDAVGGHLRILANPDNYPMLVHCQHGMTRTAKFLVMYDAAFRGMTAEESLARQPLFGRERHNVHVSAFARHFEQGHHKRYPDISGDELAMLRQ